MDAWLKSCVRKNQISRNTVAVGIVVFDHLRSECPTTTADVLSSGGEIKGSRHGLAETLEKYGLPGAKYLKEVTTRQAHQDGQRLLDAVGYGAPLAGMDEAARETFIVEAIGILVSKGREWLERQNLKIACDRQLSPATWVGSILSEAKGRSGGKVEQHLVGAKLEKRHPDVSIPNHPGHAGDIQTGRGGDFTVGTTCYHVTAAPGGSVVDKCAANLGAGLHPVLLVPREAVEKARHIAEDRGVDARLTIMAIEDFLALNVIEMSVGDQQRFLDTLKGIVASYNRRLEEVETDMSLRIELE